MDLEPKNLFSKGRSSNLGKLYGKWKAKKQGTILTVELFEHALVEVGSSESSIKSIEFDFDLKFSFTKDPFEVKFERGKDICAYGLANEA